MGILVAQSSPLHARVMVLRSSLQISFLEHRLLQEEASSVGMFLMFWNTSHLGECAAMTV